MTEASFRQLKSEFTSQNCHLIWNSVFHQVKLLHLPGSTLLPHCPGLFGKGKIYYSNILQIIKTSNSFKWEGGK